MIGIVHLAAPAPRSGTGDQLCALCGTELPPPAPNCHWPADCLVTMVSRDGQLTVGDHVHHAAIVTVEGKGLPGAVLCTTGLTPEAAHA